MAATFLGYVCPGKKIPTWNLSHKCKWFTAYEIVQPDFLSLVDANK